MFMCVSYGHKYLFARANANMLTVLSTEMNDRENPSLSTKGNASSLSFKDERIFLKKAKKTIPPTPHPKNPKTNKQTKQKTKLYN